MKNKPMIIPALIPGITFAILALIAGCGGSSGGPESAANYLDPRFEVRRTEGLVYGTSTMPDGEKVDLQLDLFEPEGPGLERNPPGVILIHGGGFRGGSRSNANLVRIAESLVERGYVVASISYRLLRDIGPAPIPERFAGLAAVPSFIAAATEDAWKATDWLHTNTLVDSDRTFIGGSSAGGITAMSLAYSPDNLGLEAPAFAGVLNLWGGSFRPEDADPGESPIFIVHGTGDRTVPFSLTEAFLLEADRAGLEYELHAPLGAGHGFGATGFFEPRDEGSYFDHLISFLARQAN